MKCPNYFQFSYAHLLTMPLISVFTLAALYGICASFYKLRKILTFYILGSYISGIEKCYFFKVKSGILK